MSAEPKLIPTSSQTVGPYFRIGLERLIGCSQCVEADDAGKITIRGRVLDSENAPVSDAMLEFWTLSSNPTNAAASAHDGFPPTFRRAATDSNGDFCVVTSPPHPVPFLDSTMQAPHLLVLVFARGLLRQLISRVYLDGEPGNASDPVLLAVPAERRRTLIAQREGDASFRWNVILQGADETVFFAW